MTITVTKENIHDIARIISTVFSARYEIRKQVDCTASQVKHGLKITGMHCFSDKNNVLVIPYEAKFSCSDLVAGKIDGKAPLTREDVESGLVFSWPDICLAFSPWKFEVSLVDTVPDKFLPDCA